MLTPTLPAYAKACGGSNIEASLVISTLSFIWLPIDSIIFVRIILAQRL